MRIIGGTMLLQIIGFYVVAFPQREEKIFLA